MSARTTERRISADPPSLRVAHFIRHRCFCTCLLSLILLSVLVVAQLVAPGPQAAPQWCPSLVIVARQVCSDYWGTESHSGFASIPDQYSRVRNCVKAWAKAQNG